MAEIHPEISIEELSNSGVSQTESKGEEGPSRQDKEIEYVMDNIATRLESLEVDEKYQTFKVALFWVCFCFFLGGATLILFGLRLTIFFEMYDDQPMDITALVFGSLFCVPMLYFFYFLCFPNNDEKKKRKKIQRDRRSRRKKTLFNQLVEEARNATEPPPRRIRVLAHIRKHDYPIIATTMQEFTDALADLCGLSVERQLLRYEGEDMVIHLDKKLDEFYGLDNGARIYVYNKGGYLTQHSPLKGTRVDMFTELNRDRERSTTAGSQGSRPNSGRRSVVGKMSLLFNKVARASFKGSEYEDDDASYNDSSKVYYTINYDDSANQLEANLAASGAAPAGAGGKVIGEASPSSFSNHSYTTAATIFKPKSKQQQAALPQHQQQSQILSLNSSGGMGSPGFAATTRPPGGFGGSVAGSSSVSGASVGGSSWASAGRNSYQRGTLGEYGDSGKQLPRPASIGSVGQQSKTGTASMTASMSASMSATSASGLKSALSDPQRRESKNMDSESQRKRSARVSFR